MELAIEELRAMLAAQVAGQGDRDIAKTRAHLDALGEVAPLPPGWSVSPVDLGGPGERHVGPEARPGRVLLYLHGGGYCLGSPKSYRSLIARLACAAEAEAFALDYRLAPEHPFPAALEDSVVAYRRLLAQERGASGLVLAGDSAGAGLAIALAVKLKELGLPQPLAIVAISPWTDLTNGGETVANEPGRDPAITAGDLHMCAAHYLADADPRAPLASPVYADLSGLAPMLIHVGGEELLLSDADALKSAARAAGVDATLEIWPEMIHVWHAFHAVLPEAEEAIDEIGAWLKRRWL